MSLGISQAGTGEEKMKRCYLIVELIRPVRFLLPVKADYKLERKVTKLKETLTNGTGRVPDFACNGCFGE